MGSQLSVELLSEGSFEDYICRELKITDLTVSLILLITILPPVVALIMYTGIIPGNPLFLPERHTSMGSVVVVIDLLSLAYTNATIHAFCYKPCIGYSPVEFVVNNHFIVEQTCIQ
jgi:hypothetical protein